MLNHAHSTHSEGTLTAVPTMVLTKYLLNHMQALTLVISFQEWYNAAASPLP